MVKLHLCHTGQAHGKRGAAVRYNKKAPNLPVLRKEACASYKDRMLDLLCAILNVQKSANFRAPSQAPLVAPHVVFVVHTDMGMV